MNNSQLSNWSDDGESDRVHARKQAILAHLIGEQGRALRTRRIRRRVAWGAAVSAILIASASFLASPAPDNHARVANHGDVPPLEVRPIDIKGDRNSQQIVRTDPELANSVVVTNSQLTDRADVQVISDEELAKLMAEFRPDFFVAKIGGQQVVVPKKSGSRGGSL